MGVGPFWTHESGWAAGVLLWDPPCVPSLWTDREAQRDRAVPNHRRPERESAHMCGGSYTGARAHSCTHVPAGACRPLCVSASAMGTLEPVDTLGPLELAHTCTRSQHHTRHSEVWLQLWGGPPSWPAGSAAPWQQPSSSPAVPCRAPTLRPSLCPSLSCRPTLRRTWIWPVDQVSA